MTELEKQLRSEFLNIRRIYKTSTQYGKTWGGNYTEAKFAWDRFGGAFGLIYKRLTGSDLNRKIVLRKRGSCGSNDLEGNRQYDRSDAEDSEALEQNQAPLISKNIATNAGQSFHND